MKQTSKFQTRRSRRFANARRGGAAVEAVIVIPLIIILMLGTLEICSRIYLKESVSICAFEGVRAGLGRTTTSQDVTDRVTEMLKDRGILLNSGGKNGSITVTPADFTGMKALDLVTVEVRVPTKGNSRFVFDSISIGMFDNFSISQEFVTASVSMVREFDEVAIIEGN